MLKKYIDFIKESNGYRIPDHFVELNSIGHYLDTLSGEMYPMYADGSFDEDEAFDVYDDLDDHDGLSEDDKRLIDSFRISIEELIGDKINLDLMEDIIQRCIDEGLVDEGVDIRIYAIVRIPDRHIDVYTIRTPDEEERVEDDKIIYTWKRLFKTDADIVKSKKDDMYYICSFKCIELEEEALKLKMDAVERFIKGAYPDEQCDFFQLLKRKAYTNPL